MQVPGLHCVIAVQPPGFPARFGYEELKMADTTVHKSSPLLIAVAWVIVVVPTAWGLTYTVQSALKIFTAGGTAVTAPPASVTSPK